MERDFNNEFERFLKENADQFRIYPSSKVWSGIYSALHTRRKWYGLGLVLLLITGSLVTLLITRTSKEPVISITKPVVTDKDVTLAEPIQSKSAIRPTNSNEQKNSAVNPVALEGYYTTTKFYTPLLTDLISVKGDHLFGGDQSSLRPFNFDVTDELTDQDIISMIQPRKKVSYPKTLSTNSFNWTIESVINSFTHTGHKKLSFQLYVTPTISYRKLSENKPFLASTSNTSYSYLYDVNNVVTHKPDLGLEFGFTSKYALSKNFRVKAGLQFNINRYDIKAFNSAFEVAKIDLRGSGGVDSVNVVSSHRNFNGYKSDWLQNFYFEIAMPVGAEVNLVGDDKVQFGVGGTLQPTYVLGDRAYLLSTDYKNYAQVPWLIRRWNVSTGLEAFVSYNTGKMKWQVGPEMRYQLLSSFISKYPVKENLFDFGLKIGVSLTK